MVYERYRTIYRRHFPSLSKRQDAALLFFIWIFPIPVTAPMLREEFTYAEYVSKPAEQMTAAGIIKFLVKAVGVLTIMFSYWKTSTFLLSLRHRVSPGLLSHEEKLTIVAFIHSAWTLIVFIVMYLGLNAPMVITCSLSTRKEERVGKTLFQTHLLLYFYGCTGFIAPPNRSPVCSAKPKMSYQCRRYLDEMLMRAP